MEEISSMADLAHKNNNGNCWCKKHNINYLGYCHLCSTRQPRKASTQMPSFDVFKEWVSVDCHTRSDEEIYQWFAQHIA